MSLPPGPVEPADMSAWLQAGSVDPDAAGTAIQVAMGWIIRHTSFSEMPATVPADLWSDWLELATIAYDNPTAATSNQAGDSIVTWGKTAAERLRQIFTDLEAKYPPLSNIPKGPLGPDYSLATPAWPDDAQRTWYGPLPGRWL